VTVLSREVVMPYVFVAYRLFVLCLQLLGSTASAIYDANLEYW
jgi:hypothetical protein